MKVLSINSIVNKYLSFKFLSYILWRIKVNPFNHKYATTN